jgi:DNA-binding GntR family transcriptional regulator
MTQTTGFVPESERVAARLREEIIDGVRSPGSRLVERDLAAEMGVSRIPVRDALRVLVGEGLVTPRPRSWAIVRQFTASDIADLTEVRAALETLAFRLAAERRTRDGLARLRRALEAETDAARKGQAVVARRAAAGFHEAVTELAANDMLRELEGTMRSRLRWLFGQHDGLVEVAAQHEALYQAIADRDTVRVERLAAEHLIASQEMATSRLREARPGMPNDEP